jgi:hypothetical protein
MMDDDRPHARGFDEHGRAVTCSNLASLCIKRGEVVEARSLVAEGLRIAMELGGRRSGALLLEAGGELAAALKDPEAASRLYASAHAIRIEIHSPLDALDQQSTDAALERLRGDLGPERFQRLWDEGLDTGFVDAVRRAAEWAEALSPPPTGDRETATPRR